MTMQPIETPKDPLETLMNDEGALSRVDNSSVAVFARSETEAQLDAAHKYPRSIGKFLKEAETLATVSQGVAESCLYALPRKQNGKEIVISGPSVRLAEIAASAYGNLHVAARILDAEEREVIAQGVAWDLEKNIRVTTEVRRRITTSKGRRYSDDMITMTGNAAASIAIRNAIFRVVPRAYIDRIYLAAKNVAVGDAKTFAAKRASLVDRLMKIGVPKERIFPRVGKSSLEDLGIEEVEALIGLGTAIHNGDTTIDEAFPPLAGEGVPAAKKLEDELRAGATAENRTSPQTPQAKAAAVPETPAPAAALASAPAAAPEPAPLEAPPTEALPDWATAPVDPRKAKS
jgi:hypothetical protein